jgi:hypothetical protein
MAAMSGAWLRRKGRHPWEGGPHRLTIHFATLDWATSNPSLSSSPWMRGAPHGGLSTLIRRISARRSGERHFQRQYRRKPARCHRTRVSGRTIVMALRTDGNHQIQLDEEQTIAVRELDAATHLPPQYDQLMSERSVLCFKSALRLERQGEQGQEEAEQSDHHR